MKKISVKKFVEEFNKIHNTLKHGYIEENLKIVEYIPIETKHKMAERIALYTTFVHREVIDENGNITLKRTQEINRDSFIKYMLYCRTLISNYTNLDIETENFYEEYDLLKSSGLLDLIMSSYIPETEIAEFKIILKMKQEDLIFNNNSTHNYVSNQIGRIENLVSTVVNPTIESITSYLNNLDEKDSKRLVSRIDKILGKLDRLVKSSK
jgi:hypothetical protein